MAITLEQLDHLARLDHEATPGPWKWNEVDQMCGPDDPDFHDPIIETDSGVYGPRAADRALIAAARTAVPALVEEVRRLTVKLGAASTQYHVMRESYEPLCQERNALQAEVERLREDLEDREGDMHLRIRSGYDKTIADAWRAKVAEVERERDEALAALTRAQAVVKAAQAWIEHLEKKGGRYLDGVPGALMDALDAYEQEDTR